MSAREKYSVYVGAFLIILAGVWHWFIAPELLKLPELLTFTSTPGYGENSTSHLAMYFILLISIVINILVVAIFLTLFSSKQQTEAHANEVARGLQQAKAKDEATLKALNQAALVSITDPKGTIVYANDKFVEVSKYTREELIGQNHRILKSGHQSQELFENLWKTIRRGKTWRGEIKNRAKDGSYYWVDTTIQPILNERENIVQYMSIRFLITDKKEAELNLQKAFNEVQKFQFAVERSFESIVITDTKGMIQYANPKFTELTGYTQKEAIGQNPSILRSGKTPRDVYDTMWNMISKGKTFTTDELINKRKDGTEYFAEITIYPVMDGDTPQFFVAMQRDVTQRKKEDRAKTEFVSIASHQLRTPLTAIRWSLGRFRKKVQKDLDPVSAELLDAATNASRRMAETINAMLNMSRLAAGKMRVKVENVHVGNMLEELRSELELQYKKKNQQFRVDCVGEWSMKTDEKLLREIVSNLLTNAIKYTPVQGKISVTVRKNKTTVTIDIQDTGYGIPKDQGDKIFTKFFRAYNVLDKEPDGNGLGLYLVREITILLGGSVAFVSELGKGTTFTVTLPLVQKPA